MKNVTIYLKPTCPFCKKAILVLKRHNVTPTIIDIAKNPNKKPEMVVLSNGRTTVPQIFVEDQHIGGCDDLVKLEKEGLLDDLLK